MKTLIRKYWKLGLSLVFALAVYWFWAFPYRSVLSFQEQYQMFLTTGDYFAEHVAVPGGLASYIGEFLTQFYYLPTIGAISLAILFLAIQRLTWSVAQTNGAKDCWYLISFIPPVVLWAYMGDENVMLAFIVSMVALLLSMLCHDVISRKADNTLSLVIRILFGLPLFYWFFGPAVILLMIYILVREFTTLKGKGIQQYLIPALAIAVTSCCINLSAKFVHYPIVRLYFGLEYHRYPVYPALMQYIVMATIVLTPLVMARLPKTEKAFAINAVALAVFGFASFLTMGFGQLKYELIDYEFLVRTEKWDKIIAMAEERQPSTPQEVASVNLALSQTGQLCDRLFEFYQNGGEGLFPNFRRDMFSPVTTAEVFFRLGMINDAERYMFEAQEAIPNYRKSGRLTKRIVECEIANGNFAVAATYLRRLQNTLFYKPWATRMLQLIKNPEAVAEHPLFKKLRANRYTKEDYLFSDMEMDQMTGLLFTCNNKNRMAYEYLMCYVLLERDIVKFMKYYPLGQYVGYDRIPRVFQQVIIGTWMQEHNDLRSMPYSVDAQTVNETVEFVRLYMSKGNRQQLDAPPYCYNAWHYIMLSELGKEEKKKEVAKEIY